MLTATCETKTRSEGTHQVSCGACALHRLCLPLGIDKEDIDRLASIVSRRRPPLRRGEYLFHAGDAFRAVYVIRAGSVKMVNGSRAGDERVTGFYLPGELIGLDAIAAGNHPCAARALETTAVCEIGYAELEALARAIPGLQRQLLRLMSGEIRHERDMMVLLGGMPAGERLAALLLNLSSRFEQRGFPARELRLSMSRHDIASYLGLAVETVSRLFSRLQSEGLISVRRRQVIIDDGDALARLVAAPLSVLNENSP
ncbi:MAG: fumarate/nitrate reduction transcriptional regulator Fnr [Chromatiales bacterium]|nr:fumarate/nitrate reduction transcriptional regulator Fnr [Chromatiales bacterium]